MYGAVCYLLYEYHARIKKGRVGGYLLEIAKLLQITVLLYYPYIVHVNRVPMIKVVTILHFVRSALSSPRDTDFLNSTDNKE